MNLNKANLVPLEWYKLLLQKKAVCAISFP